ncbi:MAG: hypothetical protein A2Y12_08525 [Planctomycetes bacterium GWF2_42_9]|nr:MAG: hypothetical protein A2Y12_08525 [Planctomycetes bacterium GWF2_42_9]
MTTLNDNNLRMTLVPPGQCSEQIKLDIRVAILNDSDSENAINVKFYLDKQSSEFLLCEKNGSTKPGEWYLAQHYWPALGYAGKHNIIADVKMGLQSFTTKTEVEVIASQTRSLRQISGAWMGITHWCDKEAKYWQEDIKRLNDKQWREVVRGMNEIEMKIIVIQEVFRHQEYVGKHNIEKNGYNGKAFYPSKLYPARMEMAADDPIEAIFAEADVTGSCVFPGVGMYAWFDFTAASLEWHKNIAKELWETYGHHKSFYGWYVSEEIHGNLGTDDNRRQEIVDFFSEFKKYVSQFAPGKPVMLAPNCHDILGGYKYWPKLLRNIDILCPFAFHRMPTGDMTGQEAANLMQKLCDETGSHLWLDMEVFLFENGASLYPRPINQVISDMTKFTNFEKILCYQYPGLMNPPWAQVKLGGQRAVNLFNDYKKFIESDLLKA